MNGLQAPEGFAGTWLRPGDLGYHDARRVWNGIHDRRPAAIARCSDVEDVSRAVRHAVALGLPVTIRGGGHNVAGTAVADGAYLVDLSLMREVRVDADIRQATAAGGCLLADLDAATSAHGLACPAGVVSHTGLGGLALGGGYGWLARKWGLTCDHILAAQVVLGDGSIVETSSVQHPELFWALRGGGGGFGVVTQFTLRLRPVSSMAYRRVVLCLDEAETALARYCQLAPRQTDDLHVVGSATRARDHDTIPRSLRGQPVFFLTALETSDGGSHVADELFGSIGGHLVDRRSFTFLELQGLADAAEPHGHRYYTKSAYLSDLSQETIKGLIVSAAEQPSPLGSIDFEYLRGAIDAPRQDESAFPRRDAPYMCTFSAHWTDPAEDQVHREWARRSVDRTAADRHGGLYLNYLHDEPDEAVTGTNGSERQRRLESVRSLYDPHGTFRSPASSAPRPSPPTNG